MACMLPTYPVRPPYGVDGDSSMVHDTIGRGSDEKVARRGEAQAILV